MRFTKTLNLKCKLQRHHTPDWSCQVSEPSKANCSMAFMLMGTFSSVFGSLHAFSIMSKALFPAKAPEIQICKPIGASVLQLICLLLALHSSVIYLISKCYR